MSTEKSRPRKLSTKSTKQEMLEAYEQVLGQLEESQRIELAPERKAEEKREADIVQLAETLSVDGAVNDIGRLRLELGKTLGQISDKLEEEVTKYEKTKSAVAIKERELKDLYEIERSAATLAALIEAQNQRRTEFESEMNQRKKELEEEIKSVRSAWEKERKEREAAAKEMEAAELKKRERDREEFSYAFKREQQLTRDKFEDEKAKCEAEIRLKREQMEKALAEREKEIAERETERTELQERVSVFPQELEAAVGKATREATERIRLESKNREELLKKEFEGERNVLKTRIESLEKTVKEQSELVARLSQQLEQSYQKVEDIAVKAIGGASESKSFAMLQQLVGEQTKKAPQDK